MLAEWLGCRGLSEFALLLYFILPFIFFSSNLLIFLIFAVLLVENGKFLLSAKRVRRTTCTEYVISMDAYSISRSNRSYIGKVRWVYFVSHSFFPLSFAIIWPSNHHIVWEGIYIVLHIIVVDRLRILLNLTIRSSIFILSFLLTKSLNNISRILVLASLWHPRQNPLKLCRCYVEWNPSTHHAEAKIHLVNEEANIHLVIWFCTWGLWLVKGHRSCIYSCI